ncbi:MAG: penicillin-binding protein [Tenuifilum sp.]|jgi:penicillin-binding protein 1C|uniref:penicillin-binding protein 1C n=1 Tax=Tenuifilum sp. TaxID=2760880 RepID=UPI0024AB7BEE|nr:penicillin-binding protein 1C [Tenuifilum sp.]MDI3526050.1 penicillin-binding protein [Tenuifilum sp.]
MKIDYRSTYVKYMLAGALLLLAFLLFVRPVHFKASTSTVLLDRNGQLLSATVTDEGMWQFLAPDSVPLRFATCLLQFEDAHFYYHPGFNPVSLVRAAIQNIRKKEIVSGASTITMQLVRLSRKGKPRTYLEKVIEIVLAFRTELAYSKKSILAMYASHAPFGGNVVGLDAAAWRYYNTSPNNLSWAEAATLAVLPNAPGLIFPGRNQHLLKTKRDFLLTKLFKKGIIDKQTYQLSLLEPLPNPTNRLKQRATHLLTRCIKDGLKGRIIHSTINLEYQNNATQIAKRYYRHFLANGIRNLAILVINNKTGEVPVYIGNILSNNPNFSSRVDIITSPRSYGSLLKPFLYAYMLSEGLLLPRQLVKDVPIAVAGFVPKNFSKTFEGAVNANEIISRSLNVPSVILLKKYGIEKFYNNIKRTGLRSINKPPSHYGLSIILGGAESTMWELARAYSALARSAINDSLRKTFISYTLNTKSQESDTFVANGIKAGAAYLTLQALTESKRPGEDGTWRNFIASQTIAWKTGTSYGFRDAWAIGVTPKYTVAVWVGNADGEGRPILIGAATAAPVMFDIFSTLPSSSWFSPPHYDLKTVTTCKKTGMLVSANCNDVIDELVPAVKAKTLPCFYHKKIFLDETEHYRVNRTCFPDKNIKDTSWFILPPAQEWFYKKTHFDYTPLPPLHPKCKTQDDLTKNIDLVYPYYGADIYIPIENDGKRGQIILKATHRKPESTIYWHLDNKFIGVTQNVHELAISPKPGSYVLTLVDENGEELKRRIKIIGEVR